MKNSLKISNFRKRKPKAISDDEGEAPKVATNSDKKPNESGNGDLRTLMGEENKNFYDVIEMADALQPKGNTLDTATVKTPVPFLLKHTLREYQHIGLDWMVSLHERKLNGILADEMGLGKTIQTIAFLAHLATEKHVWGPHLIVVPTSVMLNWEMELKKWAPAFKVLRLILAFLALFWLGLFEKLSFTRSTYFHFFSHP